MHYEQEQKFLQTSIGKIKRPRSREIRNQMWWMVEAGNLFKRMMLMADPEGLPLVGSAGTNPTEYKCLSLVSVVCCQVEFSSSDRSLVQRSPTVCVCVCVCVWHVWVWKWSLENEAHWWQLHWDEGGGRYLWCKQNINTVITRLNNYRIYWGPFRRCLVRMWCSPISSVFPHKYRSVPTILLRDHFLLLPCQFTIHYRPYSKPCNPNYWQHR
jgi:hypothetical protein